MKYRSSKGTVINIPDGLSPKEIAAIKADADAGYGTRAQKTASKLGGKRGNKNKAPPTEADPNSVNDNINDDGSITNPEDLTNQLGKPFDPNDPFWQDLYNKTYENQYSLETRGLDERKAREMEEAKQEAANRGLPYDPGNPESAYGKALSGVTTRYDTLYANAANQATSAAQGAYAAQGGLANQSFIASLQAALGISEADARAKALEIQKYGIDEDTRTKLKAINKPSGGGGGGGSGGGGGFEIS